MVVPVSLVKTLAATSLARIVAIDRVTTQDRRPRPEARTEGPEDQRTAD